MTGVPCGIEVTLAFPLLALLWVFVWSLSKGPPDEEEDDDKPVDYVRGAYRLVQSRLRLRRK